MTGLGRPDLSRHRRRRRHGGRLLGIATVAILFTAVVLLGRFGTPRTEPRPENAALPLAPSSQIHHGPTLLVIADSYALDRGYPDEPPYPTLVARTMGWNLRLDAVGGSGYIESILDGTRIGRPLGERLPEDVAKYQPDYVLIDAGRNDLDKPMEYLIPAIGTYLDNVRAAWPAATIIVVKPHFIGGQTHPNYALVSATIDVGAAKIGALTVDPVALRWYDGVDAAALTVDDGIHPNGAGSAFYADHLVAALETLGITPAPAITTSGGIS